MNLLYIHIPFCKLACNYCDFHFSTNLQRIDELVACICTEIELRKDFFNDRKLHTIYFGGGTPSLLEKSHFDKILNTFTQNFDTSELLEITLEANPDDLSINKLIELKELGFNRLSIGIQTFNNSLLNYINRAHSSQEALRCVKNAKEIGFDNISVDLIFSLPKQTLEELNHDLDIFLTLDIQHISLYGLTIEEGTVFGNWKKKKKLSVNTEDLESEMFQLIIDRLKTNGFEQYEISNFSKPNYRSVHNSGYWKGYKYLGIGPSAHSYNGVSRFENIRNNYTYIEKLTANSLAIVEETILSNEDIFNETVLISLRTKEGLDTLKLEAKSGFDLLQLKKEQLAVLESEKLILLTKHQIILTEKGKFVADSITEKLFM